MPPAIGRIVEIQVNTGRWCSAVITKIHTGNVVNVVALTDGVNPWPNSETPNGLLAACYQSVDLGTGLLNWRDLPVPAEVSAAIAAALDAAAANAATQISTALTPVSADIASMSSSVDALDTRVTTLEGVSVTTSAMDAAISTAIAAIPPPDLSGYALIPSAAAVSGYTFGAVRTPSSTRPTLVIATGYFSFTSVLLGTNTAKLELMCDATATPTTLVGEQRGQLSGVAATSQSAWMLFAVVPADHKYRIVSTLAGSGTATLMALMETQL